VEFKLGYIIITGYSLSSLLYKGRDTESKLWLYLHNGLNASIEDIYNDVLNEVENDYKYIVYINLIFKFMFTYP
jgi:hypothetical protein